MFEGPAAMVSREADPVRLEFRLLARVRRFPLRAQARDADVKISLVASPVRQFHLAQECFVARVVGQISQ